MPTWVEFLKNKYASGKRIRLIRMLDQHDPVPSGTLGSVRFVDDMGNIHVAWDNGRTLSLLPGIDEFELLGEQL